MGGPPAISQKARNHTILNHLSAASLQPRHGHSRRIEGPPSVVCATVLLAPVGLSVPECKHVELAQLGNREQHR